MPFMNWTDSKLSKPRPVGGVKAVVMPSLSRKWVFSKGKKMTNQKLMLVTAVFSIARVDFTTCYFTELLFTVNKRFRANFFFFFV